MFISVMCGIFRYGSIDGSLSMDAAGRSLAGVWVEWGGGGGGGEGQEVVRDVV